MNDSSKKVKSVFIRYPSGKQQYYNLYFEFWIPDTFLYNEWNVFNYRALDRIEESVPNYWPQSVSQSKCKKIIHSP